MNNRKATWKLLPIEFNLLVCLFSLHHALTTWIRCANNRRLSPCVETKMLPFPALWERIPYPISARSLIAIWTRRSSVLQPTLVVDSAGSSVHPYPHQGLKGGPCHSASLLRQVGRSAQDSMCHAGLQSGLPFPKINLISFPGFTWRRKTGS